MPDFAPCKVAKKQQLKSILKMTSNTILNQIEDLKQQATKQILLQNSIINNVSLTTIPLLLFMSRANKILLNQSNKISKKTLTDTLSTMLSTCIDLQNTCINIRSLITDHQQSINYNPSTISLHSVVNEIFQEATPTLHVKKIELINNISPSLKFIQLHHPIKSILYQLIINAIKYSKKDTIIINATQNNKQQIKISVIDKGIGITPSTISSLLNTTQTHQQIPQMQPEKGFGYIIINQMLQRINGHIKIQSQLQKGTTVQIHITPY